MNQPQYRKRSNLYPSCLRERWVV